MSILKKFTFSDLLTIAVFLTGIPISLYSQEIRTMINELIQHWQTFVFWGCIIGLLWRFTHIALRNRIENTIENRVQSVENLNKQLSQFIKFDQDFMIVGFRMMRDIYLPALVHTEKDKNTFAKKLLELGFNKDQLRHFGIEEDIINRFLKIYHEEEVRKINSRNNPSSSTP